MTRHIWLLFLLLPLVNQLFAQCPSPYDHVVLYEISGDAGQSDGVDDGIVEIAGPPGTNIGCMVVSNSEWAIVIPENTMIPGDGVFLIACSMRMSSDRGVGIKGTKNGIACDECDFPCLPIDFDVCDPANIQYCDFAATGFTIDNQSSVDGDQVILFRPNGVPHDALYWGMSNTLTRGGATTGGASGDADHVTVQDPTKGSYTLGTGVVPMGRGDGMDADTSAVPIMPNGAGCMARAIAWTIPNLTDPIWVKHPSPTFVGCNSSYIRINGSTGQHGAPAHSPRAGSLIPFGSLTPSSCSPSGALAQWGYTDHPNPGLPNDTLAWRLTVSNDTFCSPSAVTFTLEVFNFQHVSDNVDLLSGACDENIGSYVMPPTTDPNFIPGPFNAQTWTTYSVDKAKGITTLTYTSGILPVGTHCFTLQWDDYSNCCGSTSKTSQNECYERELVCVTVFAPLSYDCNSDGIADPIQMMCEINCATNNPVPGIINATKYVTGGGNLCYTLVDSAGVLPPKTNSTGVFILEPNPTAGGYYIKIFDKSGCPFDTLFLKIFNNCEKAPICPTMLVNTGSSPSGFYCPNDSIKLCINGTNLPIGGIVEWFIGGSANFNVDTAKFICQTNLRQQDTIPKTCCPFLIGAYINACLGAAGQEGRNEFVAFRSGCDTLLASVINVGYGTTQIAAEGASDVYNGQNFSRTGYIDTLNSRAGCNIFFPPLAGGKIPPNSTVISLYSNVDFPYNFSDLCPNTCAPIYVIFGGVNNTTGTFLNGTGTRFIAIHLDNCTATTCCGTTVKRCLNSVSFTNTGSTGNDGTYCVWGPPPSTNTLVAANSIQGTDCDTDNNSYNLTISTNCGTTGPRDAVCACPSPCPMPVENCKKIALPDSLCNVGERWIKARISPVSTSCPPGSDTLTIVKINLVCPTADIKASGIDTCLADLPGGYDIPVMVMNGVGPYKLCWSRSDVGTNTCVTGAGPNFTIHIDGPTDGEIKVKLDSVVDLGGAMCSGELDGDEICVNIRPTPTITVASHTDITSCATGCGSVTIEFEGTGPYMFSYCVDGGAEVEVFVADNTYVIEACVPGLYTIKSFTDDFGCGGTILNPSAEVIVAGTLPVITDIVGPIEYICGDSIVCHDLDTLIDVEINGTEIVHVTWYTKSPKVAGFNPGTDSVPFGIIKLKDTTEYFLIYTDPLTMCTVCDSTIVNADFLACCMPPTIRCPRDTVYPNTICNIVVPPAKTTFRRDTIGLGPNKDTIPVILNGCGPVSLSSRDSVATANCIRTVFRYYIVTDSVGFKDSCVQMISFRFDTIPPTPICPPNITLQCPADTMIARTGIAMATDNCMNPVTISRKDSVLDGRCPAEKTIWRIWSFMDDCKNSSRCLQRINIIDTSKPKFIPARIATDTMVACEFTFPPITVRATDSCQMSPVTPEAIKPWINEFHYDDVGFDTLEFIEIAGLAGTNLTGYSLVLYNGANGQSYNTLPLGGIIDNEGSCMGAVAFYYPVDGIQNGAPDGIALVFGTTVCEFISYEGSFTAVNGPAMGMMSTNIGVQESGEPSGLSLQKIGTGKMGSSFSWTGPVAHSPNTLNVGQTISPPPICMGGTPRIDTFATTYRQDSTPGRCPNEYVLRRVWTAMDSCGNRDSLVQRIMVKDTSKPIVCSPLVLPVNMTISCNRLLPADTITGIDLCDISLRGNVWINEIHYDNVGTDTAEFIEIAGYFGTNLSGYSIVLYNGATFLQYNTLPLSGTIANEKCGYGAIAFFYPINGIQNGSPDGIALVRNGVVLQFISYEGGMMALDGPAAGMTSTPFAPFEDGFGPYTSSLQLTGCGDSYSDFTWTGPIPRTPGLLNTGQIPKGNLIAVLTERVSPGVCPVKDTIFRSWALSDRCGNTFNWSQRIVTVDTSKPFAICKDTCVYLNKQGQAIISSRAFDGGSYDSCSTNLRFLASDTVFNCAERGTHAITLIVFDECNNSASCGAIITVKDTFPPMLFCKDRMFFADPGACEAIVHINVADIAMDNCDQNLMLMQPPNAPFKLDSFFPIGKHFVELMVMDQDGNIASCIMCVEVKDFPNPIRELICNDDIQLSLDDNCEITLNADMFLEGGPYHCYDDYVIEARDWITNALVDANLLKAGVQLGSRQIGKAFKIIVIDPITGNSCWSHATLEDKLAPVLTCPADTCLPCGSSYLPSVIGSAIVVENCGVANLTYIDKILRGSCSVSYQELITRKWIATDASGNKSECTQIITISRTGLGEVAVPKNYDGLEEDMLLCSGKKDTLKNVTPHYLFDPYCVDGYLLDSVYWRFTGGDPAFGDFSGQRRPKVLGWNCIDDPSDKNYGHPSPYPVYYPAHPDWLPQNPRCWAANTNVMWLGTGTPVTAGCSHLGTVYEDVIIPLATAGCDAGSVGCYKVLRQWTVLDWCTGEIGGHSQIIKVADVEGPKVLYPDTVIVNMEVWTCTGRWEVPKPWITDNCSNEIHYSVEVTEGTVLGDEQTGYVVVDMPIGVQEGYIVATDCCGNITKKLVKLNVLDNVPPNCNTRKNTVITLASNQSTGEALGKLYAKDLDEGSRDNCSPHVFFKVIRMEEMINTRNGRRPPFDNRVSCNGINGDDDPGVFAPGNQVYFDDYTKFCCADAGKTIMVVLRVFDKDPGAGPIHPNRFESIFDLEGHFSDCMVEVDIQDKQPPVVVAPPDMVVSCWYWFDPSESALEDPNNGAFGKLVTDLSSRKKVATLDLVCHQYCESNIHDYPGGRRGRLPLTSRNEGDIACDYYWTKFDTAHLDRKYELAWGFDGYALGTCAVTPTINASDNRDCGQGLITRTFSVAPGISAVQQIWVVDCDPFWVATACDQLDDIFWPDCQQLGSSIIGCGARDWSPNNMSTGGWAKVEHGGDDNCALIAIEYKDEIFRIEPDACIKIIRTWTVLDWCQYDPFDPNWKGSGRWTHTHVIKVRDEDAPVVTCTVGLCETQGLATIDPATGLCVNHITLTATAYDSCSPEDWLKWEYKIDLFNDGKGVHSGYDFRVGSLTKKEFAAGDTALVNHNPYADDNKNPFDASGTYPVGVHKIKWFVEDGCGNIAVCETLFEVKDCKAPTPYCRFGVITVVMPSSGCITIWASDFDAGSYDNCTRQSNLHLTIEGEDSLTICCQDFIDKKADDELVIPIKMCVEDEEGNKDCCTTTLVVQDPQGVCPNGGSLKGKITGEIKTETGKATTSVDVDLMNNGQLKTEMSTVNDGKYAFYSLDLGLNYEIKPSRNDDPLNGVTTADIVKMQKHILGQEELNSPYKLIAADVNRSQSITAADISEIRKLILGTTERFKSVPSWVFVPSEYVFADRTQPWNYPVSSGMLMNKKENQVDFISIKMGDVNSTVTAGLQGSSTRTSGSMNMEIMDKALEAGEIHKVEFKSSDFNNISGYQFTVKFDASAISFEGVEAGALKTTEGNFGLSRVNNGIITTSWNSSKGESYSADQVLFTLVFRANKGVQIGQAITINSEVTAAEAYDATLETKAVRLNVRTDRGVVETGVFELNQNEPNPFNKQTTVTFNLPNASPATLTMYDVTGKVLRVYEIEGLKGLNTKVINKSELNGNGVIYYQLDAANFTATKRMIIIE